MPTAIDTQTGHGPARPPATRCPGLRITTRPSANVWTSSRERVGQFRAAADGRAARPAGPAAPDGRQTRTGRPAPPTAPAAATTPANRTCAADIDARQRQRAPQTAAAPSTTSSRRSTMTVANVDVAFSPSCRASRYGRRIFADAARQQEDHRESDDRRPERRPKPHGTERLQQHQPALGPQRVGDERHADGRRRSGRDGRGSPPRQASARSTFRKNIHSSPTVNTAMTSGVPAECVGGLTVWS